MIQDFPFTVAYFRLKFQKHVDNIHIKKTVPQFLYSGPSKNGRGFAEFS